MPALLSDKHLNGIDWDTIPGLFDWVENMWATHVDVRTAVNSWAKNSNIYTFCPDGEVIHNLALALFLMPNAEPSIIPENSILKDAVFSAVIVFKPMTQNTCSIATAVDRLVEYHEKDTPALALVSLSEKSSYFPYPVRQIDYAVVLADNLMMRSMGPMSSFIFRRLLHADVSSITNVILPPSFSKEPNNLDFNWVPCPTRGSVWSNAELVDAYGDNIIHPVVVAPFTVLRPEPNDRTRHSALGL